MFFFKPEKRKKMNSLQESRFLRLVLFLVLCSFFWLLFSPETGFLSLLRQRNELKSLQVETQQLIQNNEELKKKIEKLESDQEYLEKLARDQHGMVKEDEILFDFSKEK